MSNLGFGWMRLPLLSEKQTDIDFEQVKQMVDLLNAGALPVGAEVIQEESVGPTLGADSINKSKIAGLVGIGAVMLFMIIYYRALGIISCFALLIYALTVLSNTSTLILPPTAAPLGAIARVPPLV